MKILLTESVNVEWEQIVNTLKFITILERRGEFAETFKVE
jgi:hypothetical protein